jgi:uncharacterized protein (TIGR02996 family)
VTEEAFIRAVVDHPGQDTPRLVYADWLGDHGAPDRAAYLRAERAAVVSGVTTEMCELAAGLDPMWVARVTLPPFGVCVLTDELTRRGPKLTGADVDAAECRLGVMFPADYRGFLLNSNGGVLHWLWGYVGGEAIDDQTPVTLHPLSNPDPAAPGVVQVTASVRAWLDAATPHGPDPVDAATAAAHRDLIRVGWSEGRAVLLAVRGMNRGAVYHPDVLGTDFPNPDNLAYAACGSSFAEFLARQTGRLPFWPTRPEASRVHE